MSSADFGELPQDYQHLLHLAKERHGLDVVPLEELKGGQTGAALYLVSVSAADSRRVEHLILKLDRVNKKAASSESERHRLAMSQAPRVFAERNVARLAYEIEHEGATALFYGLAGESLQRYSTLGSQESQSRQEVLFSATHDYLLRMWNAESAIERALHPQKLLERWLGYRLKPAGRIASFLEETLSLDPDTEGFLVQGQIFPNPFAFGLNRERWGQTRPIDVLTGFQHGDLNIGNILARFAEDSDDLGGYFLIDFALYKPQMPLLYDLCYLEMSYLVRELERVSLEKWVSLVVHFSGRDRPNPKAMPAELAGACAVLVAGRTSFERWVREAHPSLSDDLWGQYWLAAVAAGLNFCNKAALSKEARLAGLIYSAVHLKRYCLQFGVSLPVEVRLLYDASKWGEEAPVTRLAKAAAHHRSKLPAQPTPFIGREEQVNAGKGLLMREDVHLVTLTGPGGTGKTRLALQAAADLSDRFEDGVYFVDLAPIRDPNSVLAAIARTLRLKETSERPLLDELKEQLQARAILLLLDNFEQVTAAGPDVQELLKDCPQLKLLITSREALHVRGEHVFPVPPLTLPEADLEKPSVAQLSQCEAVRLFIERARAVKPDFTLTDENAAAVAEICLRLDGLPLAIELATARIALFSPQGLLERVGSRLKLLRGGARDLPARQQTLRDTIGWSYDLLEAWEQRLFALLSVFHGFTFEAVESVASDIERLDDAKEDTIDVLASLVDKSLVRRADQGKGEPRFLMLETIREYAAEHLEDDPEIAASARRAHAGYFADFTRRQWDRLLGSEREAALGALESDLENVQAAWDYWVAEGNLDQLHKLADCLWLLCDARGWYHAMADLTADLLNVLAATSSTGKRAEQEIMLQTSLARALMAVKGCTPEVEAAYTRALELCEQHGEVPQLFPVLRGLASYYGFVGNLENAAEMGERILSLAEQHDDASMRVEGHLVVGYSVAFLRDLGLGLDHLEKGIANYEPGQQRPGRFHFGNDPGVACLAVSGLFLWMHGFPDRALQRADDAIGLANSLQHPFSMAYALFHTGLLHLWRREAELVRERARAVLDIAEEHEFQVWSAVATCLDGAALAATGRAEEGLVQTNRGMELYQQLKTPPIFWPLLLSIAAGVHDGVGRPAQGIALLDEALGIVGQGAGFVLSSELCRLKANLLLSHSPENLAEAEPLLEQALQLARERQARALELRAAISLGRLLRGRRDVQRGRQLLSDAYESFTEGFATADLEEARSLLAELSQAARPSQS